MPENEFEKQVQGQLKDFQLSPSASVWEKVEKEIREKRRRRIIIFFIFTFALGLLAFSFYEIFYTGKTNSDSTEQSIAKKNDHSISAPETNSTTPVTNSTASDKTTSPSSPASGTVQPVTEPTTNHSTVIKPADAVPQKTDNVSGQKTAQQKRNNIIQKQNVTLTNSNLSPDKVTGSPARDKKKNTVSRKTGEDAVIVTTDMPVIQKTKTADDKPVHKGVDKPADKPADKPVPVIIDTTKAAADFAISDGQISSDKQTANSNADVTATTKDSNSKKDDTTAPGKKDEVIAKTKKPSSKFKWGVDFSGGVSFNNNSTLSFTRGEAFARTFDNAYGNVGAGASPPPPAVTPPSDIKPGAAFRLGLTAEWQVSQRSSFSTGLQYVYQSNRIDVGVPKDTTVRVTSNLNSSATDLDLSKVYSGSRDRSYTNSYHFVRVPLYYHWQLSRNKKLPIQWSGGVSFDYLVSTNALLYSSALGGIYYQDDDAFRKMHVNLGTGLSFRWSAKNGNEWSIGPEISFDLNRLVKNDNKQYLMYTGVNAKLLFPKKK